MRQFVQWLSLWKPSAAHRLIQGAFFCFIMAVGVQFLVFSRWAMNLSEFFLSRPPSVEAFLPISALMALKRLLFTGMYDPIHPAGLTILIMALLTALVARKGFCGYLCPIGALSTALFRLGRRLGLALMPPRWVNRVQGLPKYVLLLFFVYILLWNMNLADIDAFLTSRYNMVADSKMLLFFLSPSALTVGVLVLLACGSLFIPSFWCRCFCPYGALLGLVSLCSPLAVRRDPAACTQCGKCSRACPAGIDVQHQERVSCTNCTGCLECVSACPQRGCLSLRIGYTAGRSHRLPWWSLPALVLLIVAALYGWAVASGHWTSAIPQDMWRSLHKGIQSLQHY